jgi:PAS domain S-box-containing protein
MCLVAELYYRARQRAAAYGTQLAVQEEQARAAVEIARQKELLAVTLASIGDGVIVSDAQGRVTFLNHEAERLTGWSGNAAQGQPLAAVFHIINEHTRKPAECPVEKVLRLGTVVGLANHTLLVAKDGREIPIDDSGAPIRQADGTVRGVVLVFRDFTERKQAADGLAQLAAIVESSDDAILSKDDGGIIRTWNAGASKIIRDITARKQGEELLRATAAELARSNQDLEQFAYVASHDLQEPLRMVAGYLQLLSERYQGKLDEKADKYIAYAVDGAERMSGLIRDLLAYSRVNTRGEPLQPTSAQEALDFALRNLHSAIEGAAAVVTHDPLPVVRGDRIQLVQLFQNLIGNAVKFRSPDRPVQVCVSVRQEPAEWLFSVQDNGVGFEQQYENKLFLIFQRLHSRGQYPGTGIGLAICKRIVERHGGRIWATGTPGQGAVFSFTIPI